MTYFSILGSLLDNNNLSGKLPPELFQLPNLEILYAFISCHLKFFKYMNTPTRLSLLTVCLFS